MPYDDEKHRPDGTAAPNLLHLHRELFQRNCRKLLHVSIKFAIIYNRIVDIEQFVVLYRITQTGPEGAVFLLLKRKGDADEYS